MVKWDSNRMGFMSYVKIPKKCIVFFMNYYLPMAPHCLRSEKKVHFDFDFFPFYLIKCVIWQPPAMHPGDWPE